jgi:ABC-type antimicrobial peptide transport system permease subunit
MPAGPGPGHCRQTVAGTSHGSILTTVVPGAKGQSAVTHLLDSERSVAMLPIAPTSLIYFGEAVGFPLISGAIVAVFGAATLLHLLVVNVSRRRRETGLLKVLGFFDSQVV